MASINFMYRSQKKNAPLNFRLLFRHEEKDYVIGGRTQFKIYSEKEVLENPSLSGKKYWSEYHNRNNVRDIDIRNKQLEVNVELNKIENYLLELFDALDDPIKADREWLAKQIHLYYNPVPVEVEKIPTKLVDYIEYYIKYRKHELKPASVTKYRVIKHKLQRMEENRKRPILIKEVNEKFKNELLTYLLSENYAQNTIQRDLGFIKTFCRHAGYMGLETHAQLESLQIDRVKVKNIYLTIEELEAIEKKKFDLDHLDNARDWLIISCYTGQRISDFLRFNKSMIRVEDGKSLLEFTQKKTNKIMTIPLHKKVLEILEKRGGDFPRQISDQRYNEYIKTVCKEIDKKVGLKKKVYGGLQKNTENGRRKVMGYYPKYKLVTSHIGRRSFATNFYGKIPTSYLIYVTGHSSEDIFLKYIGKSNKDLAMELSNYF